MNNLVIANPERLDDHSFKISISGNDYEYEVSDDKDIDKVIAKLVQWISRGEDSFGGLYDYIKRSFQLVGEYHEPVVEETVPEEPSFKLPSDGKDLDDIQSNELEFKVDILSNNEVSISLGEFSAVFTLSGNVDNFETELKDLIKEDMSLKDRIDLNTFLVKELDTDNSVDIYNLSGLVLDPDFEIVSDESINSSDEDNTDVDTNVDLDFTSVEVPEDSISIDDIDLDVEESVEDDFDEVLIDSDEQNEDSEEDEDLDDESDEEEDSDEEPKKKKTKKKLTKKSSKSKKKSKSKKESVEFNGSVLSEDLDDISLSDTQVSNIDIDFDIDSDGDVALTFEDLISSDDFLSSLKDLGLSLFKISSNKGDLDSLYFIGGVNSNDGSIYTLTYQMGDSYITLDGEFEDLSTNDYELSNIKDLSVVTDYLGKLLDLVYSRDLGEDNEQESN